MVTGKSGKAKLLFMERSGVYFPEKNMSLELNYDDEDDYDDIKLSSNT
jgi:hypothetical protein